MTNETNHALDQTKAQYQGICSMVDALNCNYDRLDELKEEKESLEYDLNEAHTDLAENQKQNTATDEHFDAVTEANAAQDEFRNDGRENELNELINAAGDNENQEDARTVIQEDPLSIEVRSSWHSLGETLEASEFQILLCTGGPAVRILGELDEHNQPCRAWMEYQDWGTPWTRFYDADQDVLLVYCSEFYFGE